MNASLPELMKTIQSSDMFDFAKGKSNRSWNMILSFFNGAMIAIVMTGLDQDMMQKSLTCKNVNDAKKNIVWLGVVLIPVNFIFLSLGLLIFENYIGNGLSVSAEGLPFKILAGEEYVGLSADRVYPALANYGYFPTWLSATFLIGLVAAAYSSADSALTSLTTSFCLDILENDEKKTRFFVHIGTSLVLILVVLIFKEMESDSIVWKLFSWAGFTYGPLLGLFSFGMFSKRNVKDQMVPIIAIISVLLSVWIKSELDLGPEVLVINGGLTVLGLLAFSKKEAHSDPNLIDA
jgi:Na+/proline symporter